MLLDLFSRKRKKSVEIFLNTSNLDANGIVAWKKFIDIAVTAVGLSYTLVSSESVSLTDNFFFAFISDSASLSRKLLRNIPRIFIHPLSPPFHVDPYFYWIGQRSCDSNFLKILPHERNVTLITSIFRGNTFLPSFFKNCSALIGYEHFEHFLIRAASPEDEHASLVEYVLHHPSAVYLNLVEDPGLYEVWNIGICLASGRYLTNANIDDRRAPEHVEHLVDILEKHPDVAVASAGLFISATPNLDWSDADECPRMFKNVETGIYSSDILFKKVANKLFSQNLPHCMPIWRRSLHSTLGFFNEKKYGPSADWAFWLYCTSQGNNIYFDNRPLGVYLRYKGNYWYRTDTNVYEKNIRDDFGYLANLSCGESLSNKPLLPVSHNLSTIIRLFDFGASLEGLGLFVNVVSHRLMTGKGEDDLINYIIKKYLTDTDWKCWQYIYHYFRIIFKNQLVAFFIIVSAMCHDLKKTLIDKENYLFYFFLKFISFDFYECYSKQHGLLLFYLYAQSFGENELEKKLLDASYNHDKNAFWEIFPSVDLFSHCLKDILVRISSGYKIYSSANVKKNIVYFPKYSGNDYQNLLYSSVDDPDSKIEGTLDSKYFLSTNPLPDFLNIIHVHWIDKFFLKTETEGSYYAKASKIIESLLRQKSKGFKILWTIHNYQSHECIYPAIEHKFRKSLYQTADTVLIHHPMAAEKLDWLPDQDKLCICEHGPYPTVEKSLDRNMARKSLHLCENDFVVTCIGRIRKYKGLQEILPNLLEALDVIPHMKFIIAGVVDSLEVSRWLEKYSHPRLIVKGVRLSNTELDIHMKASDFGFLTYSSILTSGTLIHWLSAGRPVIAPSLGIIPAYIVNAWNGFCYEDKEQLSKLLVYSSSLPKFFCEMLSFNAEKTAETLTWRF